MKKGQKRRVFAFLLAFSMLVSCFTGVPVRAEEEQAVTGLVAGETNWNGLRNELLDSTYQKEFWSSLGERTLYLGYTDAEGTIVGSLNEYPEYSIENIIVSKDGEAAPDGSYSIRQDVYYEGEVETPNEGFFVFTFNQRGDYMISYALENVEENYITVHVDYGEVAAYSSPEATETGYLLEYQYSRGEEDNSFYFVFNVDSGAETPFALAETPLCINDDPAIDVSQYASLSEVEGKTNAYKLTIHTDTLPSNEFGLQLAYSVDYDDGMGSRENAYYIHVSEKISGLVFAYPDWDGGKAFLGEGAHFQSSGETVLGDFHVYLGYKESDESDIIAIDEYEGYSMDNFEVTLNGEVASKDSYSVAQSTYLDDEEQVDKVNEDILRFSLYERGIYRIAYPMDDRTDNYITVKATIPEFGVYQTATGEGYYVDNDFIVDGSSSANECYVVFSDACYKSITLSETPLVINGDESILASDYVSIEAVEGNPLAFRLNVNGSNMTSNEMDISIKFTGVDVNGNELEEDFRSLRAIIDNKGFVFRETYYDDVAGKECFVEDGDSFKYYLIPLGSQHFVYLEYQDEQTGETTNVWDADALTVTLNGAPAPASSYQISKNTYRVDEEENGEPVSKEYVNEGFLGFAFFQKGVYHVSYKDATSHKSVIFAVDMPRVAVYDSADIETGKYIERYNFDRYTDAEQAFYIILQKGESETITVGESPLSFDGDYGDAKVSDYLELEVIEENEVYKVIVKPEAFPYYEVGFIFSAECSNDTEPWNEEYSFGVCEKQVGLLVTDSFTGDNEETRPFDEGSFSKDLYKVYDPYNSSKFYFGYRTDEDGEITNVAVEDLVFTDENDSPVELEIDKFTNVDGEEIVQIRFQSPGTYYASYTKDGIESKVMIVVDFPDMAFYTEPERTAETLVMDDFYLMKDDDQQDVLYFIVDKSYGTFENFAFEADGYKTTPSVLNAELFDIGDENFLCYKVTLLDEGAGYLLMVSFDRVYEEESEPDVYILGMSTGKERQFYLDGKSHTGFAGCYMQDYEYAGRGINWDCGLPMYWVHADTIQGVIDKLGEVGIGETVWVDGEDKGIVNTGYFAINVSHTGNVTLTEQFVTPKNATAIQIVAGQDVQMTTHPTEEDGTYIEDSVYYVDEETRALLPAEYKNVQYISDFNGGLYVVTRYTPTSADEYNFKLGEKIEADFDEVDRCIITAEEKKMWNQFELPHLYLTMDCDYLVDGPCGAIHMQYTDGADGKLYVMDRPEEALVRKEFDKNSATYSGTFANDWTIYSCTIDKNTVQATTGTYEEDVVVKTPDDKKDLVDVETEVENGLSEEQKEALKEEDSNVELDVKTDAIDASENNLENLADTIKEAISAIKELIETILSIPQENAPVFVDISVNVTVTDSEGNLVGEEDTNITETKKPIDVTMDIPENIRGNNRRYKVVRYHDGTAEELETEVMNNGKSIRFATNKFSTYAIVYEEIVKQDFDMSQVRWDYTEEFTYDGEEKSVQLIGLPDGLIPIYENDVAYEVGNYNTTVTFQYDMTLYNAPPAVESLNWSIVAASPQKQDFDMSNVKWNYTTAFTYDGTAKTVTLTGLPAGLTANYTGNTATEVGNYVASVSFTYDTEVYNMPTQVANLNWSIVAPPAPPAPAKTDFDMSNVKWDYATAFTYDGTAKTVALTGLPSGLTATYSGNTATDAGVYTATVVFSYDAEKYNAPKAIDALTWTINKADAAVKVSKVSISKTYGDKAFSLGVTAAKGTKVAYKSSDTKVVKVSTTGKVTIKGCGQATITITASGANFETSQKKVTVTVKPKKVSIKKLTSPKKKAIKITWAKDSKVTGYEIEYSTNKKFTKKTTKKVTISKYKTISKTIGKLKSKKKYYVRIRAYKKSGKTKIYGAWSTVKNIKVK